tara:strand:- start:2427 stop:3026 length:600 start_codon:yes stop_codon:yes gene_type:complete
MPFISDKARKDASATGVKPYLNPGKIKDGESTRFAILQDTPIEFYELWGCGAQDPKVRHPFRFDQEPTPDDIKVALGEDYVRPLTKDGKSLEPVKLAQAVLVYNHDAEAVQCFQWNQKTITSQLDAISQLEDYAESFPFDVDLVLARTGQGTDTVYNLQVVPRRKGTDAAIKAALTEIEEKGYDVTRLVGGGDPFAASE